MSLLISKLFPKIRISLIIRRMSYVSTSQNGDIIEKVVCKDSDLPNNSMKEFEIGADGEKVLLVKQCNKLYAVGTKCTHYGAPLSTGALGNGRVRCPWHGACFNLGTGDIEDFPGLDSIPRFEVCLENENVKVRAKKSDLASTKRVKTMARRDPKNPETLVIIGGGAAGSSCAETVRQEGYTGRLIIISSDKYLPYDRVKINKQLDSEFSAIALRPEQFYKSNDMEVLLNEEVVSVDTVKKSVTTATHQELIYTKLFIANGAIPRKFPDSYFGTDLKNIFTLRSLEDGNNINQKISSDADVVVIGASYVGMEAASFCAGKAKSVTVIGTTAVPFERDLGVQIGNRILQLFESKGVIMKMNARVIGFEGADGLLTHVVLSDNTKLSANVCISGIGVQFDTSFLSGTEIRTTKHGTVEVDEHMRTNVEGVFSGGDVAQAPVFVNNNEKSSIGHWQLAQYHGHIAGLNIAGKSTPLKSVPFFFSMLFGKGIRYAGYGAGYTEVVIIGSVEDLKFVAYYCKGEKVIAVATIGSDPIAAKFAELLHNGKSLMKNDINENSWVNSIN